MVLERKPWYKLMWEGMSYLFRPPKSFQYISYEEFCEQHGFEPPPKTDHEALCGDMEAVAGDMRRAIDKVVGKIEHMSAQEKKK